MPTRNCQVSHNRLRKGLAKGASQAVHHNRINLLIPGISGTLPGKLTGYLPGTRRPMGWETGRTQAAGRARRRCDDWPGESPKQAAFAFQLAREKTNNLQASHRT